MVCNRVELVAVGIGMKHLWKPALNTYTEMLAMLEANYPEALKRCYIVNGKLLYQHKAFRYLHSNQHFKYVVTLFATTFSTFDISATVQLGQAIPERRYKEEDHNSRQ